MSPLVGIGGGGNLEGTGIGCTISCSSSENGLSLTSFCCRAGGSRDEGRGGILGFKSAGEDMLCRGVVSRLGGEGGVSLNERQQHP